MKDPLYPLFKHLHDEHDLILTYSQLHEIIAIVRSITYEEINSSSQSNSLSKLLKEVREAITLFREANKKS